MRLVIFNNNQLKYIFKVPYDGTKGNLATVFQKVITEKLIDNPTLKLSDTEKTRKKQLWATAFDSMAKVVLDSSAQTFKNGEKDGITVVPINKMDNNYSFYLDRGTGWCALIRNYNIYSESNSTGNIAKKNDLLTQDKPLAWENFTNTYFRITFDGSTNFVDKVIVGEQSIVPFAAGNFFGTPVKMNKDDFTSLNRLIEQTSNAVWATISVEWPVVVFDQSYQSWWADSSKIPSPILAYRNKLYEIKDFPQFSSVPQNTAGQHYLNNLKELNTFLTIIYREVRFLSNCRNFDPEDLELNKMQKSLYYTCKFLGIAASAFSLSSIPIAGINLSLGVGGVASQLFQVASNYLKSDQALDGLRGHPSKVSEVFNKMEVSISLSLATFYLFLLEFKINQEVTDLSEAEMFDKIQKVSAFINKKATKNDLLLQDFLKNQSDEVVKLEQENELLQIEKAQLQKEEDAKITMLVAKNAALKEEIAALKEKKEKAKKEQQQKPKKDQGFQKEEKT